MKKELFAGLLLLALFIGSIVNIGYMDKLAATLTEQINDSRESMNAGDFEAAQAKLREAVELWSNKDGYTHIFIRHPEIDSTTDAFYELMSDIVSEDEKSAAGSFEKLCAHIRSLATMEHLSLGSIL